jgi:hypothetical protein
MIVLMRRNLGFTRSNSTCPSRRLLMAPYIGGQVSEFRSGAIQTQDYIGLHSSFRTWFLNLSASILGHNLYGLWLEYKPGVPTPQALAGVPMSDSTWNLQSSDRISNLRLLIWHSSIFILFECIAFNFKFFHGDIGRWAWCFRRISNQLIA